VQALLQLGRVSEADVLLDEPRATHAAHPRLHALERQLASARRQPPRATKQGRAVLSTGAAD
jgi:hypothetical protein